MKTIKLILLFVLLNTLAFGQSWTQLGPMPSTYEARNHPITFSIGQFGYVMTGAGSFYNGDAYRYDPSNDSWTTLANFPGGPRSFGYGVENGGKGYVGFGLVQTSSTNVTWFRDLWEFDPATDTWRQLASLPGSGRRHPAMVATPGKIFVGCGDGPTGNLKDWWEYDIASNSWSQKPDLPSFERHHPYFFDIDGEAYVGFGHNGAAIYKDMYKYNPTSETWTTMPSLPGEGRVAGTQFSYNGKGYLLSGQGEDHFNLDTGEFWEFDPVTNTWTTLTPHPGTGRWAPGSFMIGNILYFTSGAGFGNSQLDIADFWQYDFPVALSVDDIKPVKFDVFPNPVVNQVSVTADAHIKRITITSLNGKVTSIVPVRVNQNKVTLQISDQFSSGMYFLSVQTEKGIASKQIIIQK